VALGGLAGVGLLVDRHQPHEAHQAANALMAHGMALVLQVPRHLPGAVERGIQELLVDHQHEVEPHRRFALRRVTER
jgi:hypothetical protein